MSGTTANWIWSDDSYNDHIVYFQKVMFWDSFDNNLRYKAWIPESGIWTVEDEQFSADYSYGHHYNFAERISNDLGALEIMVDINKMNSDKAHPALIFRAVDKNNHYIFRINGYGSKSWIQLYKLINGSWYQLGPNAYWDDSDDRIDKNTWYVMKVRAVGNTIKCKVWEKSQSEPSGWDIEVTDSEYSSGKIGLEYYKDHLHFDNIFATNLSSGGTQKTVALETTAILEPTNEDSINKYLDHLVKFQLPNKYVLSQNFPNPFNPETQISYQIPKASKVTLIIYNILGRQVKMLVDEKKEAGYYTAIWDGKDDRGLNLASGVYFYTINARDFSQSKWMILIR